MAVDQELDHLLYTAIENKRLIRFGYKGKSELPSLMIMEFRTG